MSPVPTAPGQIWIPPQNSTGGLSSFADIVQFTYPYGQPITIHFQDTFYFTASNLTTFTPSLPTGSFAAGTTIGPYYANSADGLVVFTATDVVTGVIYVYLITIVAPVDLPDSGDGTGS